MEIPKVEFLFSDARLNHPSVFPPRDCLVWVYDSECEIGYFWPELLKWDGESWINYEDQDFGEFLGEPKIMWWAYVTEGKNSERPDGEE